MSYAGIIDDLVAGTWQDPATGLRHGIPIEDIVITPSLEGREAELVRARHGGKRVTVVHDENTREALGARVLAALQADGGADEFVWQNPRCTPEGAKEVSEATRHAEVLVAVGSGTVSDTTKYATFLDGREYSVFATSPMTAYTTPTASVSKDGFKTSITCHSAKGVFFDLDVLANCPKRLVRAAFADVVCRATAQVDWLLSHLLLGTPYFEVAYPLLAIDEDRLIASAPGTVTGDFDALATLTRVSAIMGLTTSFTGTTHVGSMGEHMISHAIDMFAARRHPGGHPGTSHGEQVGVATLTMSRLQDEILAGDAPTMHATEIPEARLAEHYGRETARTMVEATRAKAIDAAGADRMNARFADEWDSIRARLLAKSRPYADIRNAMTAAGCQLTGADLGLGEVFFREAVRDARFIRDRFTMLDLADDSGRLVPFLGTVG